MSRFFHFPSMLDSKRIKFLTNIYHIKRHNAKNEKEKTYPRVTTVSQILTKYAQLRLMVAKGFSLTTPYNRGENRPEQLIRNQ